MNSKSGLAANALGLGESMVMGIAGTAPAFSAAATTATLIAAVGVLSPASLFYCGLIMFGVTLAFKQLNRVDPNAGASYAWVEKAFGPVLGFLAGWSLLVATALFMVSGTVPAATATLDLVAPSLTANPTSVTLVAAGWLLAVSALVVKGIKPASYTQVVLTTIEVTILILVITAALVKFGSRPAQMFSFHWFSLSQFTPQLFATGALTAVFFFWGWDVTLNLNEETKDAHHTPGHGAVLAMITVMLLFVGFAVATLLALTDAEIDRAGTNVVLAVAEKLFSPTVELHGRYRSHAQHDRNTRDVLSTVHANDVRQRSWRGVAPPLRALAQDLADPLGRDGRPDHIWIRTAVSVVVPSDGQPNHEGLSERHRFPGSLLLWPGEFRLRLEYAPGSDCKPRDHGHARTLARRERTLSDLCRDLQHPLL